MELQKTTNYRLIEGQEKQSLVNKIIGLGDSDRDDASGMEIYQISSNLSLKQERKETEKQNFFSNFIKDNFTNKEPSYTNNQENISSLSTLISKNKKSKSDQVKYQTRSTRDFSKDNLAETIRSIS